MSDEARKPKVVVVMPAYNAGRTLRMTYEELPKDTVSMVILVDDGSTDTTLEIARQLGLEIFVHNRNYGYGANQKTCYAEALRAGADIVVMVHPDYQYDPRLVPQIIEPILRGEADVVLGSRLKTGSALRQGMPWWKYVSNRFLTALENRAFRLRLSEFHTGYRAFRREVLERVNFVLNSDGFVFDQEIIAQVVAARFRIAEIAVPTLAILVLVLVLAAGFYAVAQQMDESKRDRTVPVLGGKYHVLPATLETTQWGWLDPKEPPKLVVNSGDTVAVETMMHAHNKIQPGTTMEEIVALRKANPGGGPHSLTGPIYVNGAEPGDVMEIRILKITPKAFGVNFNLPGREFPTIGALASEMPDGFVRYFYLDWDKRQAEFKPGIVVDLQPFPGTLAVGIDPKDPSPRKGGATDPMAPVSTLRPWKNGSNMDINELQEGTTIYIPIFLKGGLVC